ncbi:MAG: hypothetical protein WC295_03930 [Methanoregula sp.]
MNRDPLTENVLVSPETKKILMSIKEPGERCGDVIARVLEDRTRGAFIAYLDRLASEGDFVPLDLDPEYRAIKRATHCEWSD